MKAFFFGLVPLSDPQAADDALLPANLALDAIAARRLGELRSQLGLTQSDLARAAKELELPWSRGIVHAIQRFGSREELAHGSESGPVEASPGVRPVPDSRPTNPQSGTRRLTLTEIFSVPRILERACQNRGLPYEPVHPLWFLPRETVDLMVSGVSDPAVRSRTWPPSTDPHYR